MFVAPAAICAGLFLWLYGGPLDALTALDRMVLRGMQWAWDVGSAIVGAISRLA